jgi:hypothetical protein
VLGELGPTARDAQTVDEDVELLQGGVANAGAVVRIGAHVVRPSNPHSPNIHALLAYLRERGFAGVPEVVSVEPDGRERLVFIPGDVPFPPFPEWSQAEGALASTAALLRRFHDAQAGFAEPGDATWSDELADPAGGTLICHNDVCPENVVYRDGVAVALLDFDFAAPGRAEYDLAQLATMCVPLDTRHDAARLGRGSLDPFTRLRIVADAYGLPPDRGLFLEVLGASISNGAAFVERRVERGETAFIEMWTTMGGRERYDRRQEWFEHNLGRFADALG